MKSSFELLCCLPLVVMNSDEQFSDNVDKQMLIQLVNENVIRFPDQNTLNTKVKQIRNPQKEISGGFFMIRIWNVKKKNKSS